MTASRIYGIDLGTTYSCISYVDEWGKPVVVPNFEGDLTTPSVVHFESADNIVVGKEAKNASKVDPGRVVEFVKRNMGDATFSREIDGKSYRPEEISSYILRKLASDASQTVGDQIKDVVITCPAYFGINEREATKNAGILADLNVVNILNEPTAAAICYGDDKTKGDEVVLVYDLGGGTFDITVIAMEQGDIRVVVTGGNHNLGGKDWDDRLIEYLAEQFMTENAGESNPLDDPYSMQELAKSAEEIKKGLSAKEKYPLMVSHNGKRARVEVTREKLEELTADLLQQTIDLTRHVLEEAKGKGIGKIDQILLVGGLSKMPAVARRMQEEFGIETNLFEPDLSVAKGAALMGQKIMAGEMIREIIANETGTTIEEVDLAEIDQGTIAEAAKKATATAGGKFRLPSKDLADMATRKIINVCSKGFGVVAVDAEDGEKEYVAYLIQNNTPVPVEVTETGFGTLRPNQQQVSVRVMEQAGQTQSPSPEDNRLISEGEIAPLPANLPAGSPIHVTFRLAEDGTLSVTAVEPSSGRDLNLEVKVEGVMSQQEIEASKGMLLKQTVS
ncbi:MAG: molecular chaperone DnaK [Blastocatellia bacterium]|jgi:molecular chaperone DnaK (HSP70)|nr:molecular chaperone DnaK [Blastocatellia bacterium]